MTYHVKITRVERCTQWEVYDRDERELLAWGDERQLGTPNLFLTIAGAKELALRSVPSGAEYILTIDTPKGVKFSGPFVKS
jgi:hypothetical protein